MHTCPRACPSAPPSCPREPTSMRLPSRWSQSIFCLGESCRRSQAGTCRELKDTQMPSERHVRAGAVGCQADGEVTGSMLQRLCVVRTYPHRCSMALSPWPQREPQVTAQIYQRVVSHVLDIKYTAPRCWNALFHVDTNGETVTARSYAHVNRSQTL